MKIKFTHDFQGKLTNEQFYLTGAEIDIDEDVGNELIALHHAVAVEVANGPVEAQQAIFKNPTRADLLKDARELGLGIKPKATKKEILAALFKANREKASDGS